MPKLTVSTQVVERLQQRAEQEGCSVDDLLASLLDSPPQPTPLENIQALLLEHTTDSISVLDPDLRYVYVNPIFEVLTGFTVDEAIGKTSQQLGMPEENLRQWQAAWEAVIATRQEKIVMFDFYTLQGKRTYESRLTPIYDADNTLLYLLGIARDVTARQQKEDMLSHVANRLPGMLMRYRLYPDGRDEALFVSEGVYDIYGVTAQEAIADIGKVWAKIHPDDVEEVALSVQASAENLSFWHEEWCIQLNDDTIKWIAGRGTPQRLADGSTLWNTFILDITARKQSEEKLRQLNQRFSILFHLTPAPLALTKFETGKIIEVNEAFASSFDYSREEMLGQTTSALKLWLHHADRKLFTERIQSEHSVNNIAFQLRTKRGEVRDFIGSFALWNLDGEAVILSALMDMTEYKHLEAKAHQAEILHMELEKEKEVVALKDRFISVISHEFRTPLAIIKSSSQLLELYLSELSTERRDEVFERINHQIADLTAMTDEILSLSRVKTGHTQFLPEPVDINAFCQTLFEQIQPLGDEQQHFVFNSNVVDTILMIDTHLLQHILNNLLSNAIKYSPAGKQVTFALICEANEIVFKVSDEGIGIPEEDQRYLFQPFHRASNVGKISGTGLGLSIVREYTVLHGGTVTVDSTVDVGSTFTVTLPAVELAEV